MSEWIDVTDDLPAFYQEVMFLFELYGMNGEVVKKDIVCGHFEKKGWNVCYLYVSINLTNDEKKLKVTHWRHLPELPGVKLKKNYDFQAGMYMGLKMIQKWAEIAKDLDELKLMLKGSIVAEEMMRLGESSDE